MGEIVYGNFVMIVTMPRWDDGVGYNKRMQKFYKKIGKITDGPFQTWDNREEKEERYFLVKLGETGEEWEFWERNLRKVDIKSKPIKDCLKCNRKTSCFTRKRCNICSGVICSTCKSKYYDYTLGVCIFCRDIQEKEAKKNRKIILKDIQTNKKAELIIETEKGDFKVKADGG